MKHEGLITAELMSNPEAPVPRDMVDLEVSFMCVSSIL